VLPLPPRQALNDPLKLVWKFGSTGRRRFRTSRLSIIFFAVQRFESARRLQPYDAPVPIAKINVFSAESPGRIDVSRALGSEASAMSVYDVLPGGSSSP
jgi:hypothetical protein